MDKLPFFYYDILSRMTPGAATLATFFMIRDRMPPSWRSFFIEGQQNWKAVVVPLLLGGLCYVIGVLLFEAVDYAPVMKWLVLESDDKAFRQAWADLGEYIDKNRKLLENRSVAQVRRLRFHLWDTLVFMGGCDTGMGVIFTHCHRFQAEYKMFLHLVYPAVLFAGFSFWYGKPVWAWVDLCVIVPSLLYLSHLRNRRRWLQTLSFFKQLDLIESSVGSVGDPDLPPLEGLHRG